MFGIGLPEMILILALALIVVGPDKLPELARSVAKGVLELKKTVSTLKEDLTEDNPFDAIKPELEEAADSIKKHLGEATPDGFTGIVKDLEQGLQEVIDTDGTVIPSSTDDIIRTVAESSPAEVESDDASSLESDDISDDENTTSSKQQVALDKSEQKNENENSPPPSSPA